MGSSVRVENWPQRLYAVIDEARNKTFEWGEHDCSLFALDVVDAMCNTEIASEWRGKYSTQEEAYELLESVGGFDAVAESYGFKEVDIYQARRGDIAFIGEQQALGIVIGDQIIATGPNSLVSVPLDSATKFWSVPCHK